MIEQLLDFTNWIEKNQFKQLKKQLQYVYSHSPFYKEHFDAHNFRVESCNSMEDLRKLPPVSKKELQQHHKAFWCVGAEKIRDYTNTSGTEGKPITIPLTEADLKRLAGNEKESLALTGGDAREIYQLTTTIDRRFMAGLAYMMGARELGAGMVRTGPGLPELQWQTIQELGTTALIVVPSFLLKMLDYAEAEGVDYKATAVNKAICIGEPIRSKDLSLNALGKRIKDLWDIELYSTYASSEMATAFTECSAGQGGHLLPELVVAEILDDEGNPAPTGEPGELTITHLGVEGFPLVRFRTGDICAMFYNKCSCGRETPRLGPVLGRKHQMIKQKGTTCYPPSIFDVLDHIPQINHYQVEINNDEYGNDEVLIRYSLKEELSPKILTNHFKAGIRFTPALEELDDKTLKSMIYQPASRKPIKLVDRRREDYF